jgi:tRNA dimethylallyltransferase
MVPLVVIVGETASGKSALGLELAKLINDAAAARLELVSPRQRGAQASRTNKYDERVPQVGKAKIAKKQAEFPALPESRFAGLEGAEIICADSRTVYKGMDIGTAKPSKTEQAAVPHHLVDVVEPDEPFTVADFKRLASQAIADIAARDRLPIMVGGSGLYIDSILFDFDFGPAADPKERAKLEALSIEKLQTLIHERGIAMPENSQNKRYLVRALERGLQPPQKAPLRNNTLVLGLAPDREALHRRIQERVDVMLAAGLQAEAESLAARYGWDAEAMKSVGYHECKPPLQDKNVRDAIIMNTRHLAKRQRTWFKRNPSVQYVDNLSQAVELVTTFLSKNQ